MIRIGRAGTPERSRSASSAWLVALVCLGAATVSRTEPGFRGGAAAGPGAAFRGPEIRGITLAPIEDARLGPVGYGSDRCARALAEIAGLGAEWVALTPFGRMDDLKSLDIQHDFEIQVSENEERLQKAIAQARQVGLKVAIIPHLYVLSGEWRGRIDSGGPAGLDAWFAEYERFVLRFARLAERNRAELFSVGVEFGSTTNDQETRWRAVIAGVRSVYSGLLTYSANWDEVEYVQFWDALDLIGVNAFWPLARKPGDRFFAMREAAQETARELEQLALYWDRPILFTEFGVKSAADAALAPWEWPEHQDALIYDEGYQADAYEAVFDVMGDRPFFSGLFIWKYFADPDDETQEAPAGFSPRHKLAEELLGQWYRRPRP